MEFCAEAQKVLQEIEERENFCVDVSYYHDDSDVFESDESMIQEFGRVLSDEERYSACYFTVYNINGIVGEVGIGYTDHAQCRKDGLEALEDALVERARELGLWESAWDRYSQVPGY